MLPDPRREIHALALRPLHGANYWSARPVTRLDLVVGAYDEIHSARVPGFTDSLVEALPGLWEHRCSVGTRGGFVERLRRGTYAPHIVEHLAIELQRAAGDLVGYGRARGGDAPGEYTVVVEHRHPAVGRRAVECALELVIRGFSGRPLTVSGALRSLQEARDLPVAELPAASVGVVGGGDLRPIVRALVDRGVPEEDVSTASLRQVLDEGLPFARAEVGIVADAELGALPERYRDRDAGERLMSVVADAVRPGGVVVLPEGETGLRDRVLRSERRVAGFGSVPASAAAVLATVALRSGVGAGGP
jgi:hypothetical protein